MFQIFEMSLVAFIIIPTNLKESYGCKTSFRGLGDPATHHEGYYQKGKRHGPGIQHHIASSRIMAGIQYEGVWERDIPIGVFIQTLRNGDKFEVCFKKGEHGSGRALTPEVGCRLHD